MALNFAIIIANKIWIKRDVTIVKCPSCGRRVSPRSRFCEFCGRPFLAKESAPHEKSKDTNWILLAAVLIGGVLLGAVVMYLTKDDRQQVATATRIFDPKLRGPELATLFPEVYQVASEFICPCGTCVDDGLEACDCEMVKGASEARLFIYENLSAGHLPPHVIEMVEAKYGHRKSSRPPITFENIPPSPLQTNNK